jgi:hypothetical protein
MSTKVSKASINASIIMLGLLVERSLLINTHLFSSGESGAGKTQTSKYAISQVRLSPYFTAH